MARCHGAALNGVDAASDVCQRRLLSSNLIMSLIEQDDNI